ncbi:hypothetical protein BBK36DRAFT_1142740 [Trichoderma citrinoviride]|uniref:Uncharacterized protein n=1 Tax=Trichoderma citrinoviride TaxID=58853 RepID=A0A2T4B6E5_9HYPO|nr:hypothetical protein BBK36DRAFT_1142740 [Trichoderma citrinoviride]PTB64809.1 hypothetical protein BBK36DRAFT_1142740 [Trichoderma citrinoviride]
MGQRINGSKLARNSRGFRGYMANLKEHQEQSRSSSLPATADLDGTFVTCDKPFETLPEKTSAERSLSYKWTDNGNWGKLGEVMVFPIATSLTTKDTCATGGSSASGRGLRCSLPCDLISSGWLETMNLYGKSRHRFKGGDGDGGPREEEWLAAESKGLDWEK